MRHSFLFFCATLACSALFSPMLQAQEFNAKVTVQAPNIDIADPVTFTTLQGELQDFINSRRWTDDSYRTEERIELNLLINITQEVSATQFKAQATIQASRPVYNSTYSTTIFNHQDKNWDFDYVLYDPLEFNENAYLNELTSLVAYYVYTILALDYDSFSPEGGNPYLEKAMAISNNAQTDRKARSKGWKPYDGNYGRYWITENLSNGKFQGFRQAFYKYHRMGLDQMYNDPRQARSVILAQLTTLEAVNKSAPNALVVQLFINAKSDELVGMFGDPSISPPDKMRAINSLSKIDPSNIQKYAAINKGPRDAKSGYQSTMPNAGGDR